MEIIKINESEFPKIYGINTEVEPIKIKVQVYAQKQTDYIVGIFGDMALLAAAGVVFSYAKDIKDELTSFRYVYGANPSPIFSAKIARQIELENITAPTVDINGNPILLDGDVIKSDGTRPPSVDLIKNAVDSMGPMDTNEWWDYYSQKQLVNKAGLQTALMAITTAVPAIWAKYA